MKTFLHFLTEDSIENEYGRFSKDISLEEFTTIVGADPTAKDGYTGAYTKWLVKQYLKLNPNYRKRFAEDAYKYRDALAKFDLLKKKNKIDSNNKDINRFGISELEEYLRKFPDEAFKLKSVEKKEYDEVLSVTGNDGYVWHVYIPRTKEASCYLGQETRWCTAARSGHNQFHNYNSDTNPLYIVVRGDDLKTKFKWQFQAYSDQLADYRDREDLASIKFFPKDIQDIIMNQRWNNSMRTQLSQSINDTAKYYEKSVDDFDNLTFLRYYLNNIRKDEESGTAIGYFDVDDDDMTKMINDALKNLEYDNRQLYDNITEILIEYGKDPSKGLNTVSGQVGAVNEITNYFAYSVTDSLNYGFWKLLNEIIDIEPGMFNQYYVKIEFDSLESHIQSVDYIGSFKFGNSDLIGSLLNCCNRSMLDLFDVNYTTKYLNDDKNKPDILVRYAD